VEIVLTTKATPIYVQSRLKHSRFLSVHWEEIRVSAFKGQDLRSSDMLGNAKEMIEGAVPMMRSEGELILP
jgi:hypothetical protein